MPDTAQGNQVFDLDFHPHSDHVYTALLTGEIRSHSYSSQDGNCTLDWSIRPTKRSCRGLALNTTGDRLYSVSKDKNLHTIDPSVGKVLSEKKDAHAAAINRIIALLPNIIATGCDDGLIKLWDPRTPSCQTEIRAYTHHNDFISDFLWLADKKHLVATSGDGTLSVLDVRANKSTPVAKSDNQEDELLSIVAVRGGTKAVAGTQLGVLSIFDRKRGWGDSVDRFPGHPQPIDSLCSLTPSSSSPLLKRSADVIATGSSDGLIRLVQIHPNKLLGVVADHGDFPVERIKVDRHGRWLGSVSHDSVLKMTDLEGALEDSDSDEDEGDRDDSESEEGTEKQDLGGVRVGGDEDDGGSLLQATRHKEDAEDEDTEADSDVPPELISRKRKKKVRQKAKKKAKNSTGVDPGFFSGL